MQETKNKKIKPAKRNVDIITELLGTDILLHILRFIEPELQYFCLSTCTYWYHAI